MNKSAALKKNTEAREYLIIGRGRLAKHLSHWLHFHQESYQSWHRDLTPKKLQELITPKTWILLALSDHALEGFIAQHLNLVQNQCIHFSGSVHIKEVASFHPLMSFSWELFEKDFYARIPFITSHDPKLFTKAFPFLKNKVFSIKTQEKSRYHALCVLAGNMSVLLWQKFYQDMQEWKIPEEALHPYLEQVTQNMQKNIHSALTGPLVRKDTETLNKNLQSFKNDPAQKLFLSFMEYYNEKHKGILQSSTRKTSLHHDQLL